MKPNDREALKAILVISILLIALCVIFLDIFKKAHAEELTMMISGTTFRITKESEINRRLREGDRVYIINKKGEKIEVQLIKDNADPKNTKWVLVDKKTQEPVKK